MSGKKLGKFARGEFVAWDGEGIGRGRRHEYVMLASSAGDSAIDREGLPSHRALDLLARGFARKKHAIHVGFAVSYDVNMMLRDLPKDTLRALWNDETVEWRHGSVLYTLTYRPRKFFIVERRARGVTMKGTLWDVWPFFQGPFVSALEKYGVTDAETCAEMRRMKSRRSIFRMRDLQNIALYNQDELRFLVALMGKLHASLKAAGLVLSRWDGPGAIAAAMLERFKFRDTITADTPDAAADAMQHAYYGGRIECLQYGHTQKTIHHYDINSAYPAAMRTLPCRSFECGEWRFTKGGGHRAAAGRFALWHVRWDFGKAPLYPFPWRSANGGVYFPPAGEGWVWTPELRAAREVPALWKGVTVLGRWEWISWCEHTIKPCAWVEAIYIERQRAHARGDGAEHALKLGLNSAYGKLAQRVGAQYDERYQNWRLPPYHDLAGAGWITSTVRAQLFQAAMHAPSKILMLATDGIYSLVPLPLHVSTTKELGAWSYETHPGATIVQSGVYFLNTDIEGEYDVYSRGFDRDTLQVDAIHAAWRKGAPTFRASHERFIGLGAALSGLARFKLWRTWHREPRDLALHPWGTKRTPVLKRGERRANDPSRQLVRTHATDTRRLWGDVIGNRGQLTTPSAVPWRYGDGTLGVIKKVDRANAEHDDSWQ